MLIPISSIFVMLTFLAIAETSHLVPVVNIMVTISAVLLLLTNLLIFGITQYNQKKSREFTEMQLLLQKESDSAEYYKMLLSQNENRSILIHDIKKHLQSIKLLNEHGETEKIESYISHLIAASDLRETARICDNAMLNAILNRCQRQCIEKGIGFHADIRKNLLRQMNQNDLTSLFCNLLDNAVEAAENIPDSFIDLMVQKKENTPFVVIVLVNSCRSMPDFDQNGFPVSHKSGIGRHGFGIKSIRKAVGQYQGDLKMYYDDATATFHTIITLKQ
nr:sensor histidine kinase [uncultured Blautia sp.]